MSAIERRLRRLEASRPDAAGRLIVIASRDMLDEDARAAFLRSHQIVETNADLVVTVISRGEAGRPSMPRLVRNTAR